MIKNRPSPKGGLSTSAYVYLATHPCQRLWSHPSTVLLPLSRPLRYDTNAERVVCSVLVLCPCTSRVLVLVLVLYHHDEPLEDPSHEATTPTMASLLTRLFPLALLLTLAAGQTIPTGWIYEGCLYDNSANRALNKTCERYCIMSTSVNPRRGTRARARVRNTEVVFRR